MRASATARYRVQTIVRCRNGDFSEIAATDAEAKRAIARARRHAEKTGHVMRVQSTFAHEIVPMPSR